MSKKRKTVVKKKVARRKVRTKKVAKKAAAPTTQQVGDQVEALVKEVASKLGLNVAGVQVVRGSHPFQPSFQPRTPQVRTPVEEARDNLNKAFAQYIHALAASKTVPGSQPRTGSFEEFLKSITQG